MSSANSIFEYVSSIPPIIKLIEFERWCTEYPLGGFLEYVIILDDLIVNNF